MKHDSIIATEGYPFIIFSLIITVFVAILGKNFWLMGFFALLTVFIVWFFRNPERYFQEEEKVIISPADGKVIKIENVELNGTMSGKFRKISIFMNVFNVHVNRAPIREPLKRLTIMRGNSYLPIWTRLRWITNVMKY